MVNVKVYFLCAILLVGLMIGYLRLANHFGITDKPNHRSSHSIPIVRGAGFIFFLAILMGEIVLGLRHPWFLAGLSILAIVSFIDDLNPLSNSLRILVHLIAIIFIGLQLDLAFFPWWIWLLFLVISVGAMNTYNFMDGINGITGIYSLVTLGTLAFIEIHQVDYLNVEVLIILIISVVIFGYFNFRKNAVCFAGDVGSFTMAYLIIYAITNLIVVTGDYSFILLLSVYGVDSVLTIILRLKNRENIFRAHRSHLYQYLANQMKVDHLKIAIAYGIVQFTINIFVVYNFQYRHLSLAILVLIVLLPICVSYFYVKTKIQSKLELNEG